MDADPDTAPIISVPISCIAPAVLLAVLPLPIVVIDAKLQAGVIVAAFFYFPAVTFIVANDGGGCAVALSASAAVQTKQ